ncbi:MAG: YicC family protein [Lachnospiraceae bacterium]|nr:YicC family protein [Lachnospiraceae bacterium]
MITSMTGFGRGEYSDENKKLVIEMKSVNHRYLDVNIKLPKKLGFYEAYIRNLLKKYISRGKVDIFVTYEDMSEDSNKIIYNSAIASEYFKYAELISSELSVNNDMTASKIMRFPDVITVEEQDADEKEMEQLINQVFDEAAKSFVVTRQTEGENLKNDILEKLEKMDEYVSFIEERSPQIISEYKDKLREKVKDLLDESNTDETRIMMEVTVFADKVCVDEEIVRLKSHIDGMRNALTSGGEVGRKLDFLAQEMNREANTTLSKSSDLEITNIGIELKTMIEKIREQVQNIE